MAALRAGEFPEAAIDRNVRRLLLFAPRVGALEGFGPAAPQLAPVEDGIAIAPGASAAGTVLVGNEGGPASPGPALRVTFDDQTPGSTERRVICAQKGEMTTRINADRLVQRPLGEVTPALASTPTPHTWPAPFHPPPAHAQGRPRRLVYGPTLVEQNQGLLPAALRSSQHGC